MPNTLVDREAFEHFDGIVRRGLKTFIEVGVALAEIRDRELWRAGFESFVAYTESYGWSKTHAYDLINSAKTAISVSAIAEKSPANEAQARELSKAGDQATEAWELANEKAAEQGKPITAAIVKEAVQEVTSDIDEAYEEDAEYEEVDDEPVKRVAAQANTGEIEWYTPAPYVDAARDAMGTIECDPASNPIANRIVEADVYFTAEDDGLTHDWLGNVWLNPPYSARLVGAFAEKLLEELDSGNVTQAVILVNNATDTKWFRSLIEHSDTLCFTTGRIAFINPKGESVAGAAQGQVFIYFGTRKREFVETFSKFGWCAEAIR